MRYFILLSVLCALFLSQAQTQAVISEKNLTPNQSEQSEPSIAIHPADINMRITVWADSRNGVVAPGYAITTDDGASWSSGVKAIPPGYERGMVDPSCSINRSGKAFYCFGVMNNTTQRRDIFVSSTTDVGNNWSDVNISQSITDSNLVHMDKPYMAIDNTGGMKDGFLYITWIGADADGFPHSEVLFSVSTDGGLHWLNPPLSLASESDPGGNGSVAATNDFIPQPLNTASTHYFQDPTPVVAPNGDVYVIWIDAQDFSQAENASTFKLRKSINGGQTFSAETYTVANFNFQRYHPPSTGAVDIFNIPTIAIDKYNSDIVYMVYPDATPAQVTPIYYRLKFTKSIDGGEHWYTTPITIADKIDGIPSTTDEWEFFPWLAIQENNKLSLSYVHSHVQGTTTVLDVYLLQSTDQGVTWGDPHRVTSQSMDPSSATIHHHYMGMAS